MPPASHRKMASEADAGGVCSACKQPAASRSKSQLRTQRFTKPSGGFNARELPCGQSSLAALAPIGHGSNFEGHGQAGRADGAGSAGEGVHSFATEWWALEAGALSG